MVGSVPAGAAHSNHLFRVLPPSGWLGNALMLYPSGPNGRGAKALGPQARLLDGDGLRAAVGADDDADAVTKGYDDAAPRRLCYGQPRSTTITPGRRFLRASKQENQRLQYPPQPEGAPPPPPTFSARHNVAVARAAVRTLLVLAKLGLAPPPGGGGGEGGQRARRAERRGFRRLLGDAVAETARFTWEVIRKHRTSAGALRCLGALKGFYLNSYPAAYHFDADSMMESWSIRQARADWLRAGGRPPPPTRVPQLGVELSADANRTVWTANLQKLYHAAPDDGALHAEGALGRGACDKFHLQSRGANAYTMGECE